jgi:hypothetical protein
MEEQTEAVGSHESVVFSKFIFTTRGFGTFLKWTFLSLTAPTTPRHFLITLGYSGRHQVTMEPWLNRALGT